MDRLGFSLELQDQVSGPAGRAAAALRKLEGDALKAQGALSFHGEIEKAEKALHKMSADPGGYQKLVKVQREIAEQRKKLQKQAGLDKESFGEAFKKSFSFARIGAAAFLGEMVAEGFIGGAEKAVELVKEGVKFAFEAASKHEQTTLGYRLTLGKKGGKEGQEDVERFSKLFGLGEENTAGMFLQLRRAGFNPKAARQAFSMATDAAAGRGQGGDLGVIGGAVEGLIGIKRREGISKKQLAGLGLSDESVPAFYKRLGGHLGVSAGAAEGMAKKGGAVDPQLIINTLAEAMAKQQGGMAGTGGAAYGQSFAGKLSMIKDLPERYLGKIGDSPAWSKMTTHMGELLEKLDPETQNGQRIQASLEKLMGTVMNIIERLTSPDGIDRLTRSLEGLLKVVELMVRVTGAVGGKIADTVDDASTVSDSNKGTGERAKAGLGIASDYARIVALPATFAYEGAYAAYKMFRKEPAKNGEGGGGRTIIAPQIAVHVTAAHGEDPTHTGQKAGQAAHKEIVTLLERSAQEGGN